jgi:hypothetical protein
VRGHAKPINKGLEQKRFPGSGDTRVDAVSTQFVHSQCTGRASYPCPETPAPKRGYVVVSHKAVSRRELRLAPLRAADSSAFQIEPHFMQRLAVKPAHPFKFRIERTRHIRVTPPQMEPR